MTKLRHRTFARAYVKNGGNATRAYLALRPECDPDVAATEGWRLLRNPKVAALIDELWNQVLAKTKLDIDSVIGMVTNEAKADITRLFDETGKLLPPHEWPKDLAQCIEAVDAANGKVKLASQANARRFLLELAGRTRTVADSIDAMAEAILSDRARHLPAAPKELSHARTDTAPLDGEET